MTIGNTNVISCCKLLSLLWLIFFLCHYQSSASLLLFNDELFDCHLCWKSCKELHCRLWTLVTAKYCRSGLYRKCLYRQNLKVRAVFLYILVLRHAIEWHLQWQVRSIKEISIKQLLMAVFENVIIFV